MSGNESMMLLNVFLYIISQLRYEEKRRLNISKSLICFYAEASGRNEVTSVWEPVCVYMFSSVLCRLHVL